MYYDVDITDYLGTETSRCVEPRQYDGICGEVSHHDRAREKI